jgi:hypothetical protein
MKKLFPMIVFLTVFSGFAVGALAQSAAANDNDSAELAKIYREFDAAEKKMIPLLIEKYLGEDYSVETDGEKLDKKQVVERVKDFFERVDEITESKSTINKIEVENGLFAVEVDALTRGKFALGGKRTADFLFTSKTTDFWRKDRAGKWREVKQIDRGTKITIDGKEVSAD